MSIAYSQMCLVSLIPRNLGTMGHGGYRSIYPPWSRINFNQDFINNFAIILNKRPISSDTPPPLLL